MNQLGYQEESVEAADAVAVSESENKTTACTEKGEDSCYSAADPEIEREMSTATLESSTSQSPNVAEEQLLNNIEVEITADSLPEPTLEATLLPSCESNGTDNGNEHHGPINDVPLPEPTADLINPISVCFPSANSTDGLPISSEVAETETAAKEVVSENEAPTVQPAVSLSKKSVAFMLYGHLVAKAKSMTEKVSCTDYHPHIPANAWMMVQKAWNVVAYSLIVGKVWILEQAIWAHVLYKQMAGKAWDAVLTAWLAVSQSQVAGRAECIMKSSWNKVLHAEITNVACRKTRGVWEVVSHNQISERVWSAMQGTWSLVLQSKAAGKTWTAVQKAWNLVSRTQCLPETTPTSAKECEEAES